MLTAFEHGWLTSSKTTFDALDDEQPAFRIKVNVRMILFALRCKVKRITFDDDDILSWMSRSMRLHRRHARRRRLTTASTNPSTCAKRFVIGSASSWSGLGRKTARMILHEIYDVPQTCGVLKEMTPTSASL
ncbi:hypothetical protein NFJ02_36g91490 [Pycnococcus provasolii]